MTQEELNETKLFENVPMQLNLSDYELRSHLGWAAAFKNEETGAIRLDIRLTPEASERLGDDLINVFDLKSIGFAGIRKIAITEVKVKKVRVRDLAPEAEFVYEGLFYTVDFQDLSWIRARPKSTDLPYLGFYNPNVLPPESTLLTWDTEVLTDAKE